MKNILITDSTGQIGFELTIKLHRECQNGSVVAGYAAAISPKGKFLESDPAELTGITGSTQLAAIVGKCKIDTIYSLTALLSTTAEVKPQLTWHTGLGEFFNVLGIAREKGCAVFAPSSIGVLSNKTPKDKTPQDTTQRPKTMYGVTKVTGELLNDYYHKRFGVDVCSVCFPGLISNVTLPGGGTTGYAAEVCHAVAEEGEFICPIKEGTYTNMAYMPDALHAMVQLMEADPMRLVHRNSFNIALMSFEPDQVAAAVKRVIPDFKTSCDIDPLRQTIAESWPSLLDGSCAHRKWGWQPYYDPDTIGQDTVQVLRVHYDK